MKLKDFVQQFVEPNTLIRLVYNESGGHSTVADSWSKVSMEWEVLDDKGIYKDYINNEVVGVTDILVNDSYSEAVNITIK